MRVRSEKRSRSAAKDNLGFCGRVRVAICLLWIASTGEDERLTRRRTVSRSYDGRSAASSRQLRSVKAWEVANTQEFRKIEWNGEGNAFETLFCK